MRPPLTPETLIPAGYRNTEAVRAWFRSVLGEGFRFNVPFMTWMKENAGRKTFGEAADAWTEIRERLKTEKPPIGEQFEYNRYFRDFFADYPNRSRGEAIQCWKGKKNGPATTGMSGVIWMCWRAGKGAGRKSTDF